MENSIYTVDYFIKKFEAIDNIGKGSLQNHCTLAHCGMVDFHHPTKEAVALLLLFGGSDKTLMGSQIDFSNVWEVNDGLGKFYDGRTPKERILKKLYEIKANQEPNTEEPKVIYKTVVIDSVFKVLQEAELKES